MSINSHSKWSFPPPKGVCPAKGCDYVLNGSSIKDEQLYERSGLNKQDFFSHLRIGAYGYCFPDNYEKVKAEFIHYAEAKMNEFIKRLQDQQEKLKNNFVLLENDDSKPIFISLKDYDEIE